MTESIGGYFASLKLVSDESSFKKGVAAIGGVRKELGQVIKFAAGLSVVKDLFGGWMAAVQRDELILSKTTGLNVRDLSAWTAAVGAAGVSAGAFTGALAGVETRIQRMKLGEVDTAMARSLGMLGIGFSGFAKADAGERTRLVMQQSLAMKDQGKAAQLVSDVLGDAGKEYFWYLKMTGANLQQQLAEGRALTFTNQRTKMDAMIFGAELRKTGGALKEMGGLFGSTFAKSLTPLVQNINHLIVANKGLIATDIVKFANMLGKEVQIVVGFFERWEPRVVNLVSRLGGFDRVVKDIAIGFAAWKMAQLGMGVINLIRGIGGIAGALKALTGIGLSPVLLAFTALYLIMQDLTSTDSVLRELGKYFVDLLPASTKKDFADLWNSFKESLPSIIDGLKQVAAFLAKVGASEVLNALQQVAGALATIDMVVTDLASGNLGDMFSKLPIGKLMTDVSHGNFGSIGKDLGSLALVKNNVASTVVRLIREGVSAGKGGMDIKITVATEDGLTVKAVTALQAQYNKARQLVQQTPGGPRMPGG